MSWSFGSSARPSGSRLGSLSGDWTERWIDEALHPYRLVSGGFLALVHPRGGRFWSVESPRDRVIIVLVFNDLASPAVLYPRDLGPHAV